jgi:hypothetical protein
MRNAAIGAMAWMLLVSAAQGADNRSGGTPAPAGPAAQDGASDPQTTPSTEDKADDRQCASYGAKSGTRVYVECRLKLVELRQQSDPSTSTRQLRCRSVAFGGIVHTRCK